MAAANGGVISRYANHCYTLLCFVCNKCGGGSGGRQITYTTDWVYVTNGVTNGSLTCNQQSLLINCNADPGLTAPAWFPLKGLDPATVTEGAV